MQVDPSDTGEQQRAMGRRSGGACSADFAGAGAFAVFRLAGRGEPRTIETRAAWAREGRVKASVRSHSPAGPLEANVVRTDTSIRTSDSSRTAVALTVAIVVAALLVMIVN
jgi:hypothetical protein